MLMIRLSSITDLKLAIFDETRKHFSHILEGLLGFGEALNRISLNAMPDASPISHDGHRLPSGNNPELATDKADSVCVAISCFDFHRGRVEGEGVCFVGFKRFLTSLCVVTPCDNYVVS